MKKTFSTETTKIEVPSRIERIISKHPEIMEAYDCLKSADPRNSRLYDEDLYLGLEEI